MQPNPANENEDEQSLMDELIDTVEDGGKMARIAEPVLKVLTASLSIVAFALIFSLGHNLWPAWLIEHRRPALGIVLFILVLMLLWFPIAMEVTVNTRTLTGPGKRPRGESRPD